MFDHLSSWDSGREKPWCSSSGARLGFWRNLWHSLSSFTPPLCLLVDGLVYQQTRVTPSLTSSSGRSRYDCGQWLFTFTLVGFRHCTSKTTLSSSEGQSDLSWCGVFLLVSRVLLSSSVLSATDGTVVQGSGAGPWQGHGLGATVRLLTTAPM